MFESLLIASIDHFLDIFLVQSQSKPLLVWQRLVPVSRRPLVKDNPPHLPKREVSVGEEVPHLTVSVIDVIKQVPLDRVVLVVSVAVDGGAEVIRHISQLVGLVPESHCLYKGRLAPSGAQEMQILVCLSFLFGEK